MRSSCPRVIRSGPLILSVFNSKISGQRLASSKTSLAPLLRLSPDLTTQERASSVERRTFTLRALAALSSFSYRARLASGFAALAFTSSSRPYLATSVFRSAASLGPFISDQI